MAEEIINVELSNELSSNYLDYADETIQERAIADIRDGLKPVHLRILYDMNSLGITPDSKTVKCARIVGDVIGKLHPHGDTSAYKALVGLSQSWNMRYPLISFKGNNGSIDNDPPAAMRYTECKLSKIGYEMTQGLNQNAVDFTPNFDDTWKEPIVLPTLLPNYLMNGSEGISCGFAPKIPTHNLTEIYDACLFMLDNILSGKLDGIEEDKLEDYLVKGIMKYMKGPDFPGGGLIIDNKEWPTIIKTGKGKIITSAKYEMLETKRKEKQMIITELPYQVNKQGLVEKIEDLIDNGNIEGIKEITDSSSGEDGIKIIVTFKKNINHEIVINNLLSKTDLKKNVSYNMFGLKNKELMPMSILSAIDEFLEHCAIVIQRESQFNYDKKSERIIYVQAMLNILESDETLDEAIRIIRYDKEEKINNLMSRFNLTEEQAKYVISRQLNSISIEQFEKYQEEESILESDMKQLKEIIDNENNALYEKLISKIKELRSKYGDKRRTQIELKTETTDEDLIENEDLIITITSEGNIKSVLESEYNIQKRNGKGSKGADMKDNEIVTQLFTLKSKDDLLFVTNQGKIHHLKAYKIPKTSKSAKGKNIANYVSLEEDETLVKTIATKIDYDKDDQYLLFVTDKGQVKKLSLNMLSKRRNVTKALTLIEDHQIVDVELVNENNDIFIATSKGMSTRFNASTIRAQGRTSRGVIGIKFKEDDDKVVSLTKVIPNKHLLSVTELGLAKITPESEFACAKNRGGKGVKCHKLSEKTGDLVGVVSIDNEDLLVCTKNGKIIRLLSNSLQASSRITTGTKLIKLDKNDCVKTISLAPKTEILEESDNDEGENE